MYILALNDMRAANVENVQPVARADSREALEALLARERVDQYEEDAGHTHYGPSRWVKAFRKGGPLEWFNPPMGFRPHTVGSGIRYAGTREQWAETARLKWDEQIGTLPDVGSL